MNSVTVKTKELVGMLKVLKKSLSKTAPIFNCFWFTKKLLFAHDGTDCVSFLGSPTENLQFGAPPKLLDFLQGLKSAEAEFKLIAEKSQLKVSEVDGKSKAIFNVLSIDEVIMPDHGTAADKNNIRIGINSQLIENIKNCLPNTGDDVKFINTYGITLHLNDLIIREFATDTNVIASTAHLEALSNKKESQTFLPKVFCDNLVRCCSTTFAKVENDEPLEGVIFCSINKIYAFVGNYFIVSAMHHKIHKIDFAGIMNPYLSHCITNDIPAYNVTQTLLDTIKQCITLSSKDNLFKVIISGSKNSCILKLKIKTSEAVYDLPYTLSMYDPVIYADLNLAFNAKNLLEVLTGKDKFYLVDPIELADLTGGYIITTDKDQKNLKILGSLFIS